MRTERGLYAKTLLARLQRGDGSTFAALIADVDIQGDEALLTVDFRRGQAPELEIGERVLFELTRIDKGAVHQAQVETVSSSEDEHRKRFVFRVGQGSGPGLSTISHRRFSARVRPFDDAPVEAFVARPGGERVPVAVRDLSATGVSLLVSFEDESRLFDAWQLRLGLRLPLQADFLHFVAGVRHRRLDEGGVVYGLGFSAEETDDFVAKQRRVFGYVSICQAELLRRLLGRVRPRRLSA